MAIIYIQGSDDFVPQVLTVDDNSSDWWGGVQQCFAGVAAAAVLAASLLSTAVAQDLTQSDPAEPPPQTIDEDYWINPGQTQGPVYQQLPLGDPEEIPAGSLFGQPDEDFWINPVAPVPLTYIWPQQSGFDVQEPAGSLFGQPDEDFWVNPVAPVPATFAWPQQFSFDVQEPAGSLFGQPDEDYWQNPVASVPLTFISPLQWTFDVQEPALFCPEEDYWQGSAIVPATSRPRVFSDTDDLVTATLNPDEDYWINPAASTPATFAWPQPFGFEQNDITAAPAVNEDYWLNPSAPVALTFACPQQFAFDPDFAPFVALQVEDEYWQNPVAPLPATFIYPRPFAIDAQDFAPFVALPIDEDIWCNPVAPVPATFIWPQQWKFETEPAGLIAPTAHLDEDHWLQFRAWPAAVPPILFTGEGEIPHFGAFTPTSEALVKNIVIVPQSQTKTSVLGQCSVQFTTAPAKTNCGKIVLVYQVTVANIAIEEEPGVSIVIK